MIPIYEVSESRKAMMKAREVGEPVYALIAGNLVTVDRYGAVYQCCDDQAERIAFALRYGTAQRVPLA